MQVSERPRFLRDFKKLKAEHRRMYLAVLKRDFLPALAAFEADPLRYRWPTKLRVERLSNWDGVMAFTWNFSGPDGRATFTLEQDGDAWVCTMRRVGTHKIYDAP